MYTERTNNAAAPTREEVAAVCREGTGQLPACGILSFPYVAMQGTTPMRYDDQEALRQGTLFPGLDLPFHKELRSRFPQVDGPLLELMALDFAIDELGLYLTTIPMTQKLWSCIGPTSGWARRGSSAIVKNAVRCCRRTLHRAAISG